MIWPANWETFIPDLIVGAITGVVIGVFVLLLQLGVERRGRRRLARQASLRTVQPLLLLLQRPKYFPSYTNIALPRKHRSALDFIEGAQLDEWHEQRPTELTRRLMRYRSILRDFDRDGDNLSQALERWFAIHGPEPKVRQWVTAKLLGAGEYVLKDIPRDKTERRRISRDADEVLDHRNIRKSAGAYRQAERRAEKAMSELLPVLIAEVRKGRPQHRPRRHR